MSTKVHHLPGPVERKLAAARRRKGMTQLDVAEALHLPGISTASQIAHVEAGRRCRPQLRREIAKVVGCKLTTDELLQRRSLNEPGGRS